MVAMGADMDISGPLENFFKSPSHAPAPDGDGVLYNLRSDLEKLYGKESEFEGDPSHAMLAMTGILIGIDYISQCYSQKQSGTSFIDSVIELGGIDWDNAEAIYQLRCALLHSFSFSTISNRESFHKGVRFNFKVTADSPATVVHLERATGSEAYYRANIWGLKMCFTRMISELEKICRDGNHKKHNVILNRVCRRGEEKLLKE
jgi:hypothetical protein